MVFPYKWFRIPFALGGTRTAVPDTVQGDGSVSYPDGYGPDYELDPAVAPAALVMPRDKDNQLKYDVTQALQYLQAGNVPAWIDSTTNAGSAYSYPVGAIVQYTDGLIYQSIVAANTTTPGTDVTKWVPLYPNVVWPTGGSANAYILTLAPALPAYVTGVPIRVKFNASNTGYAGATININGLGAKAIKRPFGSQLLPGDLVSTVEAYTLIYNGTYFTVQELFSNALAGSGSGNSGVNVPNDSAPHTILDLANVTTGAFALVEVIASNAFSGTYNAVVNAVQFATSLTPSALSSQNTPGAISFSMSGTALQMTVVGGSGDLTVDVKLISS